MYGWINMVAFYLSIGKCILCSVYMVSCYRVVEK